MYRMVEGGLVDWVLGVKLFSAAFFGAEVCCDWKRTSGVPGGILLARATTEPSPETFCLGKFFAGKTIRCDLISTFEDTGFVERMLGNCEWSELTGRALLHEYRVVFNAPVAKACLNALVKSDVESMLR